MYQYMHLYMKLKFVYKRPIHHGKKSLYKFVIKEVKRLMNKEFIKKVML